MTKSTSLSDVLPLLPALNKRDLLLVRAAVDRLLGAAEAPAGLLYDAVMAVARVKMPFSKFRGSKAYKGWAANEKLVLGFVDETWGKLNKVLYNALLVYLIEMLADDLKRRHVPVSVGSLAFNLSSVPEVFDRNFPGYTEAGLSPLILEAMVRK